MALLLLVSTISFFIHSGERCKDLEDRSPKVTQKVKLVGYQWDKIVMLEQKIDDQTNQIEHLVTWQEAQTKLLNDIERKVDQILQSFQKEHTPIPNEDNKWW